MLYFFPGQINEKCVLEAADLQYEESLGTKSLKYLPPQKRRKSKKNKAENSFGLLA